MIVRQKERYIGYGQIEIQKNIEIWADKKIQIERQIENYIERQVERCIERQIERFSSIEKTDRFEDKYTQKDNKKVRMKKKKLNI